MLLGGPAGLPPPPSRGQPSGHRGSLAARRAGAFGIGGFGFNVSEDLEQLFTFPPPTPPPSRLALLRP